MNASTGKTKMTGARIDWASVDKILHFMRDSQDRQSIKSLPLLMAKSCEMKRNKRYRDSFNPKRQIRECDAGDVPFLMDLLSKVRYGGNPQHKKNPGDFGLTPPSQPRSLKSLCDSAFVFRRSEALNLLREGVARGMISVQTNEYGFPQNIWAVKSLPDGTEIPLEAQIENPMVGSYHGYPLLPSDTMSGIVLSKWRMSPCLVSK